MITESLSLNILIWICICAATVVCAYFLILLLSFLYLFAVCLTCSRSKKYTKFSRYYYHVYKFGARLLCRAARIRLHVSGAENIPLDQKFLLVSNHRSNWDNIVQAVAFSKTPMAYISKKENFKIPFVGRLVNRCLFLSIDRGNLKEGLQTILSGIEMVKSQVISVAVFPEGTRSKDCKLQAFKPGCLKIAEKAKCPLVIVATRGTENVHENFPLKPTDVYVDLIEVLLPEQIAGKKTVELAEITQEKVRNFLEGND